MESDMPTMTLPLGTVSYRDVGEGTPILALHATMHDSADYAGIEPALSETHRLITVDWPGHGASPTPEKPLTAAQLGTLAVDVVDRLGLRDLVVIGNSVGGYAACRIALERPDRVAGLVLVNTGGFTPHSPFSRAFCAVLGRPSVLRAIAPVFARGYLRPQSAADRDVLTRVRAAARTTAGADTGAALWRSFTEPAHDLRDAASAITAPVLITWGARDLTAPVAWGRVVADAIPGARLVTLPTGHVPFTSAPRLWLDEVLPFLARISAGPANGTATRS
jgi:pimeloyl-ACP methyl ester carboxylesterase